VVLDHVEGFFCIYSDDLVVFVFGSIDVLYYIHRFAYVEPPLLPWDEADLVMVYDLSDVFLDCMETIQFTIASKEKETQIPRSKFNKGCE
jgi:hypothetical protein